MILAPVIAFVGPSGVGKDSVMAGVEARVPGMSRMRRVITRPDGQEGEDFDQVSVVVFEDMVANGAFVLHWHAHGLNYGIPSEINALRRSSKAVLVNLSRSILLQAQEIFCDLVVISLTAESEVLAGRLSSRGRETEAEQMQRLERADTPVPQGLRRVIEVDNSGPLETAVDAVVSQLQPERA